MAAPAGDMSAAVASGFPGRSPDPNCSVVTYSITFEPLVLRGATARYTGESPLPRFVTT